ncbi:MAG: Dabb family protein [Bacteroidia bacterium]|nr:Dabb family protein [Bacteroidia bacterium]
MIRHVVLFTFRETSPAEEVSAVVSAFRGLNGQVPEIQAFEWGLNISPEHFHQGFTHCFVLTFRSLEDLAAYQVHPAHLAFQEVLRPHMDRVFVVDYAPTAG